MLVTFERASDFGREEKQWTKEFNSVEDLWNYMWTLHHTLIIENNPKYKITVYDGYVE